jgi:hypothetical protein
VAEAERACSTCASKALKLAIGQLKELTFSLRSGNAEARKRWLPVPLEKHTQK